MVLVDGRVHCGLQLFDPLLVSLLPPAAFCLALLVHRVLATKEELIRLPWQNNSVGYILFWSTGPTTCLCRVTFSFKCDDNFGVEYIVITSCEHFCPKSQVMKFTFSSKNPNEYLRDDFLWKLFSVQNLKWDKYAFSSKIRSRYKWSLDVNIFVPNRSVNLSDQT